MCEKVGDMDKALYTGHSAHLNEPQATATAFLQDTIFIS